MKKSIKFYTQDISFNLPQKKITKQAIKRIFLDEHYTLNTLLIIFCNDSYLHTLNLKYLNHDTLTDVITFNLSSKKNIEGEVYISIDRINENSIIYKTSFLFELCRIIVHSILHLCGYTDKKTEQKKRMAQLENYYLAKYFQEHSFT